MFQSSTKINLILTEKKTRETNRRTSSFHSEQRCPISTRLSREPRFSWYNPQNPYSEHLSRTLPTFFSSLLSYHRYHSEIVNLENRHFPLMRWPWEFFMRFSWKFQQKNLHEHSWNVKSPFLHDAQYNIYWIGSRVKRNLHILVSFK